MLAGIPATFGGAVLIVFGEGWATWYQEPVARPGMSGMFWDQNVLAGLCPGDAGGEEELLVQITRQRYTIRVGFALALRARRHTAQLDFASK